MVCARLMLNGIDVYKPLTEDTPIDLLILSKNGNVFKCQCKCLYVNKDRGCHTLNLYSVRKNGPNSKAVKHVYTMKEVDFFLAYCKETDNVYVIPFKECSGRVEISLWLTKEPKGNCHLFHFDCEKFRNAFDFLK
jgi:hypothetical protein